MRPPLGTSPLLLWLLWLCECGTFSLPRAPPPSRPLCSAPLLCTLPQGGDAHMVPGGGGGHPPRQGSSSVRAGAEVGDAGDKKGFTILRVLSEGGTARSQKGKGKPKGERLDGVLMQLDPRSYPTPSAAKKEIRKGAILVNGARGRVDQVVHLGSEQIAVQGRTSTTFKALGGAPFTIKVLYQDNHIAAVVKPPGVCTHPPPHSGGVAVGGTTADRMTMTVAVPYFVTPSREGTERMLWRPTVVHRLDKLTEGVQLVAKTKQAAVDLQAQFTARTVHKRYIAVVEGSVEGEQGVIDLDVAGKGAVSGWRVLHRTRSPSVPGTHLTTLELTPRTGRTHQLRIHCAEGLGMPIVGDRTYGGVNLGCGLLLCAAGISFEHPLTRERLEYGMGEPERFVRTRDAEDRAFCLGEAGLDGGEDRHGASDWGGSEALSEGFGSREDDFGDVGPEGEGGDAGESTVE